jgi:hypothetical protein
MATTNNSKLGKTLSNTTSATSNYANLTASNLTVSPAWTTASTYSNIFYNPELDITSLNCNFLLFVAKYFTEEEIEKLLSDISERANSINENISDTFGRCVRVLVRARHFSEDFLMKYYESLSREDILALHTPDVSSGTYAQLALLLANDDSKSGNREYNN